MKKPDCHPHLAYKALGMCATCYGKSRAHLLPRASCHPDKPKITKDGLCQLCSDRRHYAKEGPRKQRARQRRPRQLLKKYGITEAQFQDLKQAQGGLCAVCLGRQRAPGKSELCIDHCHKTGAVRGLLCDQCNRGLGLMGDSLQRLMAAVEYLKRFTAPTDKGSIGAGCDA